MPHEFHLKYRPKGLKSIIGQPEAVRQLEGFIKSDKVPHAILFSGGPGTGKTTMARILKTVLNCGDGDFAEYNAANTRGIDTIREINTRIGLAPIGGDCRMWLLDEIHQATKDAQEALLKVLEDTPAHVYFILATTAPDKLIATVKSRCTHIKLAAIGKKHLDELIHSVLDREKIRLSDKVIDAVVEAAEGSARNALVVLNAVACVEGEQAQLDAIIPDDIKKSSFEIARKIVASGRWVEIAALLKEVKEEPELIRRMILSYANSVLLSGKENKKAYVVLCAFEGQFFDTGKAGIAMLTRACYEAVHG